MGSHLVTHVHPPVHIPPIERTAKAATPLSVQGSFWPPSPVQASQGQHTCACLPPQIMKEFHGKDAAESLLTEDMANVTARAQAIGLARKGGRGARRRDEGGKGELLLSERSWKWIKGSSGERKELWKKEIPRRGLRTPLCQMPTCGQVRVPRRKLLYNRLYIEVEEGKVTWIDKVFLHGSSGAFCFLFVCVPHGERSEGSAEKPQRCSESRNSPVSVSSQRRVTAAHYRRDHVSLTCHILFPHRKNGGNENNRR